MLTNAVPNENVLDVDWLEGHMSRPTDAVVAMMKRLSGDILLLGAGGKIGPSIARMAKRASDQAETPRRIIGVSRFSDPAAEARLKAYGVETVRADLLDRQQLESLPDAENIIYLAGFKFGAAAEPALTWAMNTLLPGYVMERYRDSRVVAFSTGSIYGLSDLARAGAVETDPVQPTDEYGMSCLGRERIIEYFSSKRGTKASLLRLNYAVELRYGVLVDIAEMVFTEQPIDLTMGHFNVIWQGDANAMALCTLEKVSSPPFILNVVGPELLSVRRVAEMFGQIMNKRVQFQGTESPRCLLTNGHLGQQLFGNPRIPIGQIIQWTADWIVQGGETHKKPTRFQVRDGKY